MRGNWRDKNTLNLWNLSQDWVVDDREMWRHFDILYEKKIFRNSRLLKFYSKNLFISGFQSKLWNRIKNVFWGIFVFLSYRMISRYIIIVSLHLLWWYIPSIQLIVEASHTWIWHHISVCRTEGVSKLTGMLHFHFYTSEATFHIQTSNYLKT